MRSKGYQKKGVSRRTFLKLSGALGLATSVNFPGVVLGKEPEKIKVGAVWPLSGLLAKGGDASKVGGEIAISEINAAGGIKSLGGAKIELLIGDSQSKSEIGMGEEERLIQRGVAAMVGCWSSDITLAATQVAAKYGVPHIVDMATAPEITQRGFKNIFKLPATPDIVALDIVRDLKEVIQLTGVQPKTCAFLTVNTLFGQNIAKSCPKEIGKVLQILANSLYPAGTPDLSSELTKLKALKPDILFVCNYLPDSMLLARQMKMLNFDTMAVWGMYAAGPNEPEYITNLGELAQYTINTSEDADHRSKRYIEVATKFSKIRNQSMIRMSMDGIYAYTTMYILADALERAKSTDKEKLIEALSKTNYKDHMLATPAPITFDKDGQNAISCNVMHQILKGRFEVVLPKSWQTAKPVFPMPKWTER